MYLGRPHRVLLSFKRDICHYTAEDGVITREKEAALEDTDSAEGTKAELWPQVSHHLTEHHRGKESFRRNLPEKTQDFKTALGAST